MPRKDEIDAAGRIDRTRQTYDEIAGRFLDFRETFIDDGDVDMLAALRVYREVGYDGMLMPDHVPQIAGDEGGRQAFAYTFGYIKALMRVLDSAS